MFISLSKLLVNWPVKVIVAGLVMIVLLAVGARNINLATGNDTLIRTDSEVYQDNLALESEFGGEAIIVLLEGKDEKSLITPENFNNLQALENHLKQYDEIYTIISPASALMQISSKQYDLYQSGIREVATGLETMGAKLVEISEGIQKNSETTLELPDMDALITELDGGFSKMITAQQKLGEGTDMLLSGYLNFGSQLKGVANQLQAVSNSLENFEQQVMQLNGISAQIMQLSKKMTQITENSGMLTQVPENTITGLQGVQEKLGDKLGGLSSLKTNQEAQRADLLKLGEGLFSMGDSLLKISSNLETMLTHVDALAPSIPTKQDTLDKMIYDEQGEMRTMFTEMITDGRYMKFVVKLNGDVSDAIKSEITLSINEFMENHPIENTEMLVSGKPVLDIAIRSSMKSSMQKMMGLSVIFMIIVLILTFKVKWSLLPLVTIMIAVIGTVGIMGWFDIPVTMVSMAVFPILIGLGIDYSIQFQSRYSEEMEGH